MGNKLEGYNEPNSPDYKNSAEEQLSQVSEDMRRSGLNPSDVFTLRMFLGELRKALKVSGNVQAAISLAIGVLVKAKAAWLEAHPNTDADQWPPHRKMPVRFGDPRQELRGLLLGRTKNATRTQEPNREAWKKKNPTHE